MRKKHSKHFTLFLKNDVQFCSVCRIQLLIGVRAVGRQDNIRTVQQFIGIISKSICKLLDIGADRLQILFRRNLPADLRRKILRGLLAAEEDSSAVHTGAAEIPDRSFVAAADVQNNDQTACLILAEEGTGLSADHQDRYFILIFLHMDTGTVTGVALDQNMSAAHGVTGRVPGGAVDADKAVVHRVGSRVLGVAVNADVGAVHIGSQRVAGRAVDGDILAGKPCANIALADAAFNDDIPVRGVPDFFVELLIIQSFGVDDHVCHFLPS